MSKKSRRRNKKILGLLGVLGAGLAMANKGKRTGVSGSDKAKFTSDAAYSMPKDDMEFKETIVSAPIKKPIVNLGKMEGFGTERGVIGQRKRANYATRIRDSQNADMMRAMRSNDAYRGMVPEVDFFSGASAKKGGRIVKTKSGGKALRGYGRAYKGKK
jgi:hypothetical protein